jgi:hypothetical protein
MSRKTRNAKTNATNANDATNANVSPVTTNVATNVNTNAKTIDAQTIETCQSLIDQLRACDDARECKRIRSRLRRQFNVYGGLMTRANDVARSNARSNHDIVTLIKR